MTLLRPSTADDHEAVLALLAARDQADYGDPLATRLSALNRWRTRDFDPGRDAVVAEDGGELAGYAALFDAGSLAFVHPEREGEGFGSALLDWAQRRSRGQEVFRQGLAAANQRGHELLGSAGYRRVSSAYMMALATAEAPQAPAPPEGLTLTQIEPERDSLELHEADMRGFAGNADYRVETFETFHDEHLASPELHPPSSLLARRGKDIVGFVLCRRFDHIGYVDLLAVNPTARRQGLGTVLLLTAIERLRADGAREARLHVSSDNPNALALYTGVGMTAAQEVVVMEKPARRP